jgi:hypothetical protein
MESPIKEAFNLGVVMQYALDVLIAEAERAADAGDAQAMKKAFTRAQYLAERMQIAGIDMPMGGSDGT